MFEGGRGRGRIPFRGRFTIGIADRDGITWHLHLTATEARQFVDYVDEHT
jgi:hypothetical protein